MTALEAGAEDFAHNDGVYEIITAPEDFSRVRDALKAAGYRLTVEEITMIPQNQVRVSGSEAKRLLKLLELLEDHDDVAEVYGNFDLETEELIQLGN